MKEKKKFQSLYVRKLKSGYHPRASDTSSTYSWKNWQIRSQALIMFAAEQTVVMLMVVIINVIAYHMLIKYFTNSCNSVMIEQNIDQSQNLMFQYSSSSQYLLDRSAHHLMKAARLYEYLQTVGWLQVEQPYECLNNFTDAYQYQYDYTFCYGFFEAYSRLNHDDRLALNYSSMLTQVLPMMDMDLDLLFSTVNSESYFSIWPGDPFKGYHPHKRVWYTGHLEAVQKNPTLFSVFSEPYVIWTWFEFEITQTKSMLYLNGSIAGVLGSDVNMSLVQAFSNNYTDVQASIIDRTGMILLSQYDISDITYFNDTNVTGFDNQDFYQILNLVDGKRIVNNCPQTDNIFGKQNLQILCRYNQVLNQEEFILAKALDDQDMLIILEFKALSQDNEIRLQIELIQDKLVILFHDYIAIIVAVLLSQIMLVLFMIYLIFRPLINLTLFTNQHIFKENRILSESLKCRIQFSHVTKNDEFHNLLFAFKRMIRALHRQKKYQAMVCACLSSNYLPKKSNHQIELQEYHNQIVEQNFLIQDQYHLRLNLNFILRNI